MGGIRRISSLMKTVPTLGEIHETMHWDRMTNEVLSKIGNVTDAEVWKYMANPTASSHIFMTEYCCDDPARRGFAIDKTLSALYNFCLRQYEPVVLEQNRSFMKEQKFADLYGELTDILPRIRYCLVPRTSDGSGMRIVPQELDRCSMFLYDWLGMGHTSHVQAFIHWQSQVGLPYVASAHLRATRCFLPHGNSAFSVADSRISALDFQSAVSQFHAEFKATRRVSLSDGNVCR